MNRLRQMSLFAHIVEAGSISAAATKLELSKSVVSQHLKGLEQELGVALIKRTTRRQSLTAMGERFYVQCKEMNSIADTAWEMVQGTLHEPQGRFRITAPNALMDRLIAPVIAELMRDYPKLVPVLIADDQPLNIMEHDIDLAIRVGHSEDSNLKQRRLGAFHDVLCGTPDKVAAELESLPYVANAWQGSSITHEFTGNEGATYTFQGNANCQANSFHSCLSLIRAGVGIGIIPDFCLPELAPELVNLVPGFTLPQNPVYALIPFERHPPAAVQLCIDALAKRLSLRL